MQKTQKLTNNEWATNLQVVGPYRCKCRHVLVPAYGHPYHPQVRGCAAPCAVVEEPNGELGPTTTVARVRIPRTMKVRGLVQSMSPLAMGVIGRTGPMRVAAKSAHSRGDRGRTRVVVGQGG